MGCGLSKAHSNPEVLVSHGSARLTVHGRRLIVQSREAGLVTRSSRPHTTLTKTSDEVEQKVLTARAAHRDGPDVLGPKVGVPARPVSRILRRHAVPYLRDS